MHRKRFIYLLVALVISILLLIGSFYTGMLTQVANWLQTGETTQTTPTTSVKTSPFSSLIPDKPPVLDDPLTNKNNPNQWGIGLNGSVTCFFEERKSYHLTAPANTDGGGCSLDAKDARYDNFVYQIKMVIVEGSGSKLRAGPGFCWNPEKLGGSVYEVKFNSQGEWNLIMLTGGAASPAEYHLLLSGKSKSFQRGTGQANYITVRAENHKIAIHVNGEAISSPFTDEKQLCGGRLGLGLQPGTENANISFNDAKVWQL